MYGMTTSWAKKSFNRGYEGPISFISLFLRFISFRGGGNDFKISKRKIKNLTLNGNFYILLGYI